MDKAKSESTKDKLRWTTSYNVPTGDFSVSTKNFADWTAANPTIKVDRAWWTRMILNKQFETTVKTPDHPTPHTLPLRTTS
jgi:hypothetical protein